MEQTQLFENNVEKIFSEAYRIEGREGVEARRRYLRGQGEIAIGRGRYTLAEMICQRFVKEDPKYAVAHSNLGTVLANVHHDAEGALQCFKTAITLDSENALLHYNLGCMLASRKQYKEAEASLCKAIELDPREFDSYEALSDVLEEQGRYKEAEEVLKSFGDRNSK